MNGISLISRGYVCPPSSFTPSPTPIINILPEAGQVLLVKALEVPLPPSLTEALGIHQSDIIIRSALVAGIANLRAEPWLLDYVFASLPKDDLTMAVYGEKEVQNAKNWFSQTDIPVFMDYTPQTAKLPCISIELATSEELENTLADKHYVPQEESESRWPILFGPFQPVTYNAATGAMTLPSISESVLIVNTEMYIVDSVGKSYAILSVDGSVAKIMPGVVADFGKATIRHQKPLLMTQLESANFKETYRLGLHTEGEPVHLTYLHSIVSFLLLAYREVLLEARGFERSTISSSGFIRNASLDAELAHSRFITITGFVRNYWPKASKSRIQGTGTQINVGEVNNSGTVFVSGDGTPDDDAWLSQDSLSPRAK